MSEEYDDNIVDLAAFREKKEREEEEKRRVEEEAQEDADISYLKEVLSVMLQSLPPVTGSFYIPVPADDNYYFDSSHMGYHYPEEEDIAPSDDRFISYDWGWAEEDDNEDF